MAESPGATAYIGLGSNLGDGRATIRCAWQLLGSQPGVVALSLSSPYRTSPVQMTSMQWFTNAVGMISTTLPPVQLLACLLDIEERLGRDRRSGPDRTIDLDLLSYADLLLAGHNLILPHPELHKRLFVLVPLAELDPDWRHPVSGHTVTQLLDELRSQDQRIEITAWTT